MSSVGSRQRRRRAGGAARRTSDGTPARTQRDRRGESDARIIAAAIELFARQGYRKTTLLQIGLGAGYTGTLVSNRFGSKSGLLRAVLAHILNRFETDERVGPIVNRDKPAAVLLSDFIAAYLQDAAREESRIRAMHVIMGEAMGGLSDIRDQVIKVNHAFRERVADYIRHGIATGAFGADVETDKAAMIIVGMLRGVTTQCLTEPGRIGMDDLIPSVQASVLALLRQ